VLVSLIKQSGGWNLTHWATRR